MLGLLSAVLQFTLPLGLAYADARLAAEGGRAQAHAESDRSSNCRPVHSPECGLCRFLTNHSATALGPATVIDTRGAARLVRPRAPAFPRLAACALPRPRGPPSV